MSSLDKAEPFDPAYANDAQKLCGMKNADVKGGVGPFGLWVLASSNLAEKTAVFFRVFKDGHGKPLVLMCSDPTKYDFTTSLIQLPSTSHLMKTNLSIDFKCKWEGILLVHFNSMGHFLFYAYRSSLTAGLYKPTFAGFVDTDISSGKISLRSLVCTKFIR